MEEKQWDRRNVSQVLAVVTQNIFIFQWSFDETVFVSVTLYAVLKWFNAEGHSNLQVTVFARLSSRNPEVNWCSIFMCIFEGELWGINAFIVASSDSICLCCRWETIIHDWGGGWAGWFYLSESIMMWNRTRCSSNLNSKAIQKIHSLFQKSLFNMSQLPRDRAPMGTCCHTCVRVEGGACSDQYWPAAGSTPVEGVLG